jgi:regulator of RNase E activity RraA
MKGQINVAVNCGGVTVHPGDIVVGDESGVVVIPRSHVREIIEEACQVVAKEEEITAEIEKGRTIFEVLKLHRYLD